MQPDQLQAKWRVATETDTHTPPPPYLLYLRYYTTFTTLLLVRRGSGRASFSSKARRKHTHSSSSSSINDADSQNSHTRARWIQKMVLGRMEWWILFQSCVVAFLSVCVVVRRIRCGEKYPRRHVEKFDPSRRRLINEAIAKDTATKVSTMKRNEKEQKRNVETTATRRTPPLSSYAIRGVKIDPRGFARFGVETRHHRTKNVVWRRYSEFFDLREALAKKYPHAIPKLPPKRSIFLSSVDDRFLAKRREGLSIWLARVAKRVDLCDDILFRAFFAAEPAVTRTRGTQRQCSVEPPSTSSLSAPSSSSRRRKNQEKKMTNEDRAANALLCTYRDLKRWVSSSDDDDGWELLGRTPFVKLSMHFPSCKNGVILSRSVGVVDAPTYAVATLILDTRRKHEYDDMFKSMQVVQTLDRAVVNERLAALVETETSFNERLEVLWCVVRRTETRSPIPSLLSARDSVALVSCVRILNEVNENDTELERYAVLVDSFPHEKAPPSDAYVRASVRGGFLLRPAPSSSFEPSTAFSSSESSTASSSSSTPPFPNKQTTFTSAIESDDEKKDTEENDEESNPLRPNVVAASVSSKSERELRTLWKSSIRLDIKGSGLPRWILKRVAPKQGLENFRRIRRAAAVAEKWPERRLFLKNL